jgi:uncharacterized protein YbjT (DUF2867 family)
MSRDHYESGQFLRATGLSHTILQDSFYSELAVQMFNDEGVMKGPGGQGKVSWVGREEIAEAAAKLLASDRPVLGTFPMTGPSALSLSETATLLSSLKCRTLRYEDEPVDAARAWRSKLGVPAWEVDTWVVPTKLSPRANLKGSILPPRRSLEDRPAIWKLTLLLVQPSDGSCGCR